MKKLLRSLTLERNGLCWQQRALNAISKATLVVILMFSGAGIANAQGPRFSKNPNAVVVIPNQIVTNYAELPAGFIECGSISEGEWSITNTANDIFGFGDWSQISNIDLSPVGCTNSLWTGGYSGSIPNVLSASQTVAIPAGAQYLSFEYLSVLVDTENDGLDATTITIDGDIVWSVLHSTASDTPGYVDQLVDVSAYAGSSVEIVIGNNTPLDNIQGNVLIGCLAFLCPDSPCVVDYTCPSDAILECGADINDLTLTGAPIVSSDCTVEVSQVTVASENNTGCLATYTRIWTIQVIGGPSYTCTQMITVEDTEGPVFTDLPATLNFTCVDDVPPMSEETAIDCNEIAVNEPFQSNTGLDTSNCVLTTPIGPGPDWAVWLDGLKLAGLQANDYYRWVPGTAYMSFYGDGTAKIWGQVENMTNNTQKWDAEFWMENGKNWADWSAMGRSYKNDLNLAGLNYLNWTYYEMVPVLSHLVGVGANVGSELYLSHQPSNYYFGFQFGIAANNRNANAGGSGWFYYWGTVDGEDVTGHGDVTTNKDCEPNNPDVTCVDEFTRFYRAVDACGNVTIASTVITVNDNVAPIIENCPESITIECDQEIPGPVDPSTIIATDNCTDVTVSLFNVGEVVSIDECTSSVTYIYLAEDECDNRTFCTQVITIVDTTAPELTVPADATYECDQEIVYEAATATDNCQTATVTELESETIQGNCPQNYTLIRNFVADDGCGNVTNGSQTINVVDTTAPVFSPFDIQVYVECTDVETTIPTATDNCDLEVTVTYVDVLNSGGCLGTIERTFTASDDCGNTATAIQYISIQDTTPPVIEVPADQTVECDDVPEGNVELANIFDNCGLEVEVSFSIEMQEGPCENSYTILWIWSALDYCENPAMDTTTITVVDTTAPVITTPQGGTFSCEQEVVYGEGSASDNCDEEVTVTINDVEVPGECPQSYSIVRTWTAEDNCGNISTASVTYFVIDETAPMFDEQNNEYSYECDEVIEVVQPTATDNCGEISYTSEDVWEVESDCDGLLIRTWTATDECDNSSTFTQFISIFDETAPVIAGAFEVTVPCDDLSLIPYPTATDNCTEVVEVIVIGDLYVSGACAGRFTRTYAAYDDCENYIEWQQQVTLTDIVAPVITSQTLDATYECGSEYPTPTATFEDNCDQELVYTSDMAATFDGCITTITWTIIATDNCDNSTTATIVYTIVDTTNPYFDEIPENITVSCEDAIPAVITPEAFDTCDEEVDVEVSEVIVSGSCPQSYTIIRTYRAYDNCGNDVVESSMVYVLDETAPMFDEQNNEYSYECDEVIVVIQPTASDNCGEITYTSEDVWEVESDCDGLLIRTWTATDECDNSSSFSQFISIYDETAPVIMGMFEVTLPCDDLSMLEFPTATDNCSEEVEVFIVDEQLVSGACAGRITRTYGAYDNCENYTEWEQQITLIDITAPVANIDPEDATYECDQEWSAAEVTFTDNCDDDLILEPTAIGTTNGCTSIYVYTWTATDHCGNITIVTQTITVTDTTAPVANINPEDMTYECDEEWSAADVTFTDNCDEDLTLLPSVVEETDGCTTTFTYTWTASDDCENSVSVNQVITIVDTTNPIVFAPQNDFFNCDQEIVYGTAFATDNCDTDVNLTFEDVILQGNCPQSYSIVRTWTAVDNCDNAGTASATYTVSDEESPVFDEQQTQYSYECDEVIELITPTASDNCGEVTLSFEDFWFTESDCFGYLFRNWTAVDECLNESYFTQYISISDETAPIIVGQFEVTAPCDDLSQIPFPTATDNCTEIVEVIVVGDELASGACAGRIIRTYGAYDDCFNYTEWLQQITLIDVTAPVASVDPLDATYECDEEWSPATVNFTDNCDEQLVSTANVIQEIDGCTTTFLYIWTATDLCGNTTTVDQNITIVDTTDPFFEIESYEITVPCNASVLIATPDAFDNCDEEVEVIPSSETIQGDCPGEYTQIFTFTAYDNCDNSAVVIITVNHEDTEAPVLSNIPFSNEYSCDEDIVFVVPTAEDNCSEATVITAEEIIAGDCPNSYTIVRTYYAMDECGNESESVSVSYYIYDNTAPTFDSEVENEAFECVDWSAYTAQVVTASDNCGTASVVPVVLGLQSDDCGNGVWSVTYTATDLCGNTATLVYFINVQDTTDPILSEEPANLVLECGAELPEVPVVTASDNCDNEVSVVYTETCIGDCPTDEGDSSCEIKTPILPGNNPCVYPVDWAMALFAMPNSHKWYQLSIGDFITNDDGTIHLIATMVNAYNSNAGFYIDVTFANGLDWAAWSTQAFPTGFKADCGGEAINHTTWMYFLLQAGEGAELIGWGDYAGSAINLSHAPANNYFGFQLGDGANNYSGVNGFGGWFTYNGTFLVNGEPIMSGNATGAGDFALEVDCCPDYQIVRCWTATDCTGNMTEYCQTITYGDLDSDFSNVSFDVAPTVAEKGDIAIVSVQPNPSSVKSQIVFESTKEGKLSLQVLDVTGRVVADLFNNKVEAGITYRADFEANQFEAGTYMIRLTNGTEMKIERILVVR